MSSGAGPEYREYHGHEEFTILAAFLMLCRDEKLARLQTRFNPADGMIAIHNNGNFVEAASLVEPEERRKIEQFFAEFLGGESAAALRLVWASGHAFTDASLKPRSSTYKYVSLQNLASIAALEKVVGAPIDPLQFRSNLYIDGVPEWSELDWVGREICIEIAASRSSRQPFAVSRRW